MDDFSILEYNNNDRDSCIELLKKTFIDSSDEKTFSWRFESLNRPDPLIVCTKDGHKVVAFLSWIPWEFTLNGINFWGYQAGELATDPAYRGKGLAGKMFIYGNKIASLKNIDFLFSFPKAMSYSARAHFKAGYTSVGNYYSHIKVLNPFSRRVLYNDNIPDYLLSKSVSLERNRITPVFTRDYYKWRYTENTKSYETIHYTKSEDLAIFILRKRTYKISKTNIKIDYMNLVDCQFTTYNDLFIRDAMNFLFRYYSRKVLFISLFFNEHTVKGSILKKFFHTKLKSKFEMLCVKPISKNIDKNILLNFNNWEILPNIKDIY